MKGTLEVNQSAVRSFLNILNDFLDKWEKGKEIEELNAAFKPLNDSAKLLRRLIDDNPKVLKKLDEIMGWITQHLDDPQDSFKRRISNLKRELALAFDIKEKSKRRTFFRLKKPISVLLRSEPPSVN